MEKTLALLYPLAGRYLEHISIVDCNDQGVEFIQARADITIKEILDPTMDPMLINDFIPSKCRVTNQTNDVMLSTQITMLKCGGLALGISLPFVEAGFSNLVNDDEVHVTKKLSFNESAISNMKAKVKLTGKRVTHQLSKVQLVSALIWKAFIGVDHAIYGQPRDSVSIQPVALRQKKEKISSRVPKNALRNHWGIAATKCGSTKMTNELHDLTFLLADSYENHKRLLENDARGDGVEAYVTMGVKDVPHFEQDEGTKTFSA
ncbi:Chloramphenicol acetyltransferase-like domain-containing protein [Artemisia annua]|uniref:Chloramphenicol acetyltransferase-like domain-containing protein n=1 Tax=Artemisia annua TaxID=35608 RepID=A0A2U1QJZ7_ARTAN|nr:Chloramphenicol acetyltransferase-like domain-containing protein [Artemisia annua]